MTSEHTGKRKFSQFMAYHILGHKNLIKDLAVMYKESKTNKFRYNGTLSCPCLDRVPRTCSYLPVHLKKQFFINTRPFFLR